MAIKTTFQQKYRVVLLLQLSDSTTPNGKNMSGNLNHQLTLHCVCFLKNIFGMPEPISSCR